MLAVVEGEGLAAIAFGRQGAGPAAQGAGGLEDGHAVPGPGRAQRGRQARPAGADDGDAHGYMRPSACIFQASQNLRSGVSAMRWCSTWKFSASISRSSVR